MPVRTPATGANGSKPPTRSATSRRTARFAVSNSGESRPVESVRSNGPRATSGAGRIGPSAMSASDSACVSADSHSGHGSQSASVNAISGARAAASPALRDAAGPDWDSSRTTRAPQSSAMSAVASVDASSTTTASQGPA